MARQFNGTTQAANTANTIDLTGTNKVSLAFWLWWDAFADDDDVAFEFGSAWPSGGFAVIPNNASDAGTLEIACATGALSYATYTRPTAAAWHHYVATFDMALAAAEPNLYLDGVLQTPLDRPLNENSPGNFLNDTLYFMSRTASTLFGAGRLAEVGLWSVILTQTNATNLSAGAFPDSIPTGLVSYWKFCGDDSPELDSADSHNATLVAAPTKVAHPSQVSSSCVTLPSGKIHRRTYRPRPFAPGMAR